MPEDDFDGGYVSRTILAEIKARRWDYSHLAVRMGTSRVSAKDIALGVKRVSPTIACMLQNAFGSEAGFWLRLQDKQDEKEATK